ncbi:MAG: hypothetical protein RIQ54_515 [Candidatus Parcubacteria bacterium]
MIVFVGLLTVGIVSAFWGQLSSVYVPDDFKNARLEGAVISESIVSLSNQLSNDLARVNTLDDQGRYDEAIELADALIGQSKDIRVKANQLSTQLETMTRSLDGITSSDARDVALSAITERIAMIESLISYSDQLTRVLTILRGRFVGETIQQLKVSEAIIRINQEVERINTSNQKAAESMKRFDDLVLSK